MRRLSRLFSRSTRDSPARGIPRDQTQEEIILRSDDSDSDRDVPDGQTSTGTNEKTRNISEASGPISAASSERGLDRDVAQELQQRLFEAVASDDVQLLKGVLADVEKQKFSLEIAELCDPDTAGKTALHTALENKKFNVANHLIETQNKKFLQSTYVNITKQIPASRKSAVHSAAEAGNKEVMEKLLEKLSREKSDLVDGWLRASAVSDFKSEQVVIINDKLGKRRVLAMHLAVLNGHTDLIKTLLSFGFDIDCEDSESETPLSIAVRMGHLETAAALLDSKAGVDHANAYSCTALHLAVTDARKDMVKLLLERGNADVNTERIKSPKTPIEMAANHGKQKMVQALLKKDIKLEYRHQAMMIAARKGQLDIVRCILENDRDKLIDRPDDNGNTVLMEAASENYLPTVKYLVSEGADLYCKNHARQTVFDIAMGIPNNSLIQFLLGINREKQRDLKREAFYLHVAATNGDVKKIEYLLANCGFDFYALDEHQNTFLHTAAFHNRPAVLEKFISPEDDIDTLKNNEGETPLHIAAKRGYFGCVEHLLKTKSKLSIADRNGQTPLHAALGSTTICSSIVKALVDAIRAGNNVILNEQDVLGSTALHLAVAGKRPEILKLLADLDPEIENKEGDTALHVAAEHGTPEVLEAYLHEFCGPGKRGKIDHKDVDGFSALHRCAKVADAVKVDHMLNHGADLALTDENGKTVLHTMVDSYANNPTLDEKLVEVYSTIVDYSTKWFCWKNDMRVPMEESREFYLTQLDAVLLLTSGMFSEGLNAIQYASKKGASKLLNAILNTPNVYRFNKNRPVSLKGKGLEELHDVGSMHKQHRDKRCLLMNLRTDDVLFDVTYLVPGLVPKQECNVIGNPVPQFDSSPQIGRNSSRKSVGENHRKQDGRNEVAILPNSDQKKTFPKTEQTKAAKSVVSCLELIVNKGNEETADEMLIEAPFCSLVSNYWKLCRRTFEALMWIHVIFMVCFTYFVMPSNSWLHWRFGTNSSTVDPDSYKNPSEFYPPALFGIFLLWPVCNLLFSLVNGLATLFSGQAMNDLIGGSMIKRLKIGDITSGLLRIPIGILLFIFDNLSQISSLAFGAAYIAWYAMFIHADNAHRYLECLAMAFIFGWLHTISFVKGFKDWNAMAAILKQILLKDVTRFIYIYIFILISFGYAIHAIIQADYHLDPDYRSPTSTIYLTFYRMLSPGNVLDVSESDDYKRSGGSVAVLRAVCSAYSILTSVVLMNLLIAMMNSTYSDVREEKPTAWRIESLRMALWIERHFPLSRLKLLRLKKTMHDNGQNRWYMTYKAEDGRNEWDTTDESKSNSDSDDEEKEEEQQEAKEIEVKQSSDIAALRVEISKIRQELELKKQADLQLVQYVSELKSDVKAIHQLFRETSQLARITRP